MHKTKKATNQFYIFLLLGFQFLLASFSISANTDIFTTEEQQWLNKQQTISIAVMQYWPPISMVNAKGTVQGIDIDIINAINSRIGNKLRIVPGAWDDIYNKAKNKQYDAIMGITPKEFRKQYFNFTTPYLSVPHVIVSNKADPSFYQTAKDLSGKTIALEKDFVNVSYFKNNYPKVTIKTYKDTLEALEAVSRGDADAYAGSRVVVLYLIEKQLLSNLKINGKLSKPATSLAIGSRNDQPLLASIIQKTLDDIGQKQIRFITNKWIPLLNTTNQLNALNLTESEEIWLKEHPHLTVGIMSGWPPFNFVDTTGAPKGIGVDIIKELNKRLQNRISIQPGDWKQIYADTKDKKLDMIMDITPKPAREEFFNFTTPYLDVPHIIVANKVADFIESEDGLREKTLALEKGFGNVKYFRNKFPKVKLKLYDNTEQALEAVSRGDANAYAGNRVVALYLIEKLALSNLKIHGRLNKNGSILAIGTRKDYPILRDILQKALNDIAETGLRKISNNWIYNRPENNSESIDLSHSEKQWIAQHKQITIGVDGNWPPIDFMDEQQNFSGISAEYLKLISKKTGIEFIPEKSQSFKAMLEKVMSGDLAVGSTISFKKSRAEKLFFSKPFFLVKKVIITTKEHQRNLNNIQKLFGKTVAIEDGFLTMREVQELYPEITIKPVKSTLQALQEVSWGEVDAYIGNQAVSNWLSRKHQLNNLIVSGSAGLNNGPQNFAVSKLKPEWEPLISIINKSLDSITLEQKLAIEQRWILNKQSTQSARKTILSKEQKNWLSQHPIFRLGVDKGWQPLEYIDTEGRYQGLASEYMRYFEQQLGIEFTPPKPYQWTEVLNKLKNKHLDVAPLLNKTPKRAQYLNFTKPYLSFPNAVFNRHGDTLLSGLSELEGKNVGVTAGYSIVNLLKKDYPKIKLVEFDSTSKGLHALSQGKVEAYIDVLAIGAYIIASDGISNLQVAASTQYNNYFTIGVRKDWPELIPILNKVIDETPEEIKNQFLKKWLVVKFAQKTDYTLFYWALVIFIVVVSLLTLRAKEIANVNAKLTEANNAVIRASEFKSQFLANMSHELRTPMNAIVGLSHLLSRTNLNAKQQGYIHNLQKSADIQMSLINDILDFSKIEAGELHIENKTFNLEEFITELSNLTSIRLDNKNVEYIYEIDPTITQLLIGDSFRLNQILTNMISNAIKFTESGHILLKVARIEQTAQIITIQFTVSDTGIGISAKELKRLFTPFTQADNSTTRKYGGTGLGLSICKQLTELMNGSISVKSKKGYGSDFQVTLPFSISKQNSGKKILENPSVDLRNLRILLVDDNLLALQIIGELLESLSFQVTSAHSGQHAIEIMSDLNTEFDVVLIDWQMPEMNGIETLTALKNQIKRHKQPLYIMMTAYAKDELTSQLEDDFVDALLIKPITSSNLFNAIISCQKDSLSTVKTTDIHPITITPLHGHVLLAEDNKINQQVAKELLEQMGLSVDIRENGEDVLSYLQHSTPDLILMDIQMPKLDGYQTTLEIRKNPSIKDIPIFAMTANAMLEDIKQSETMGMQEHISKPVDPNKLYKTLSHYLPSAHDQNNTLLPPDQTDKPTVIKHWPDAIDGLNISLGIKQVGGNESLYQKLLKDFVQNHQHSARNIQDWLSQGELSKVARVAHTLKGVSGNIGAKRLQSAASNIDKQLKKDNAIEENAVNEFTAACNELCTSLKTLMNIEHENEPSHQISPNQHADAQSKDRIIQLLIEQLQQGNSEAKNTFIQNKDLLIKYVSIDELNEIDSLIKDYEFEKAILLLNTI